MKITIKEKVIRKAIAQIEKRLEKVKAVLDASPLSEICEIRIKAQEIMKKHKGDYGKIAELIEPLSEEEKRLFVLAKKKVNSSKLIDEQVRLQVELGDLNGELYYIERAKNES